MSYSFMFWHLLIWIAVEVIMWLIYAYNFRIKWGCELDMLDNCIKKYLQPSQIEDIVDVVKELDPNLIKWLRSDAGRAPSYFFWERKKDDYLFQTACHEAGHVVAHWFSRDPRCILYATIIPRRKETGGFDNGHVKFVASNSFLRYSEIFNTMCTTMGGALATEMIMPAIFKTLHTDISDILMLSVKAYLLASRTLEETGENDTMKLMYFYIRRCYDLTLALLRTHKRKIRKVAIALYEEKTLEKDALQTLLGPRPKLEKSLYEEFVKGRIYFDETTTLPVGLRLRFKKWLRRRSEVTAREDPINPA